MNKYKHLKLHAKTNYKNKTKKQKHQIQNTIKYIALYEPPDGSLLLGSWIDTESPASSPSGGDSPVHWNNAVGIKASVFQLAQDIPLAISPFDQSEQTANVSFIQDTGM